MVAQIKGWDIGPSRLVPPTSDRGRTQLSTLHAEATSCVGFGEGINAFGKSSFMVQDLITQHQNKQNINFKWVVVEIFMV